MNYGFNETDVTHIELDVRAALYGVNHTNTSVNLKRYSSEVLVFINRTVHPNTVDAEQKFYTLSISDKGLSVEEIQRHRANFEKFDDLHRRGLIFERAEDCENYINALTALNEKVINGFDL